MRGKSGVFGASRTERTASEWARAATRRARAFVPREFYKDTFLFPKSKSTLDTFKKGVNGISQRTALGALFRNRHRFGPPLYSKAPFSPMIFATEFAGGCECFGFGRGAVGGLAVQLGARASARRLYGQNILMRLCRALQKFLKRPAKFWSYRDGAERHLFGQRGLSRSA